MRRSKAIGTSVTAAIIAFVAVIAFSGWYVYTSYPQGILPSNPVTTTETSVLTSYSTNTITKTDIYTSIVPTTITVGTTSDQTATQTVSITDVQTTTLYSTITATTTDTVTASSCSGVSGPPGRTYCGPIFDILDYGIFVHNNSAYFKFEIMFTGNILYSVQFTDDAGTPNSTNSTLQCNLPQGTMDQGQILTCSGAGFSPPITTSAYSYDVSVHMQNTGDTELSVAQSWSAIFLEVSP